MLEGMLETFAEYYSRNLTRHIKRGMRESVINGTSTGGVPPIGYKCVDKCDANSCVDSIVATDNAAVKRRLEKKLEELELQKADVDIDISKLRIASGIQYTKEQVVAWIKSFCAGNMDDEAFQRRIIDVFVNSVYVYDDKIVIFYNMRSSKQTSPLTVLDTVEKIYDSTAQSNSKVVRISNDPLHQFRKTA